MAEIIMVVPWRCGDPDCEAAWHSGTYWTSDEPGEKYTYDELNDGDHEPVDELPTLLEEIQAWISYGIYVYEHGLDPLNNFHISTYRCVNQRWKYLLGLRGERLYVREIQRRGIPVPVDKLPGEVKAYLCLDDGEDMLRVTPEQLYQHDGAVNVWKSATIPVHVKRSKKKVHDELVEAARSFVATKTAQLNAQRNSTEKEHHDVRL